MNIKEQLLQKIAQGKTDTVIESLLVISKKDKELFYETISLSARYKKYTKDKNLNLENKNEIDIEINKINVAAIDIINRLPETQKLVSFWNWKKTVTYLISGIGVLAGIAEFSGFSCRDFTTGSESKSETSDVTVFVVGKKGCTDLILREKGKVIMRIERTGETKIESITDKGEAKFSGLTLGERIRLEIDFSEPYRAVKNDTVYLVSNSQGICMEVALQNLEKIFGTVFFKNRPLSEVSVSIHPQVTTTTNVQGYFNLEIPPQYQRKEQEVTFFKEGFEMLQKKAFPQTNTSLSVMMKSNEK